MLKNIYVANAFFHSFITFSFGPPSSSSHRIINERESERESVTHTTFFPQRTQTICLRCFLFSGRERDTHTQLERKINKLATGICFLDGGIENKNKTQMRPAFHEMFVVYVSQLTHHKRGDICCLHRVNEMKLFATLEG